MAYLNIEDFKNGLDTRKYRLALPAGTLTSIINGHITAGGEIEKRKAFVRPVIMPANTFGMEPVTSGIAVFGSVDMTGTTMPSPFIYVRCQSNTGAAMSGIIWSTSFGDETFCIAQFADGKVLAFYNGVLVSDFISGLGAVTFDTAETIASGLAALVNATTGYTAVNNGNGTFDIYSVPTTGSAKPYTVAVTVTSAGGTLTDSLVSTGTPATSASIATGTFQIIAGGDNIHASGTLTSDGTNVSDGDTVTVGTQVYRFKNTMAAAFDVKIGGSAAVSLTNLYLAINATGTAGTNYYTGTTANTKATATNPTATTLIAAAINAGVPGNSIAASKTAAHLAWSGLSGGNLSGGTDVNKVIQVSIGGVNLLASEVPFNQNINQTASDVAFGITANSGSGFSATATGNSVTVSTLTGTDAYDNNPIITTCAGSVCIGQCVISLSGTSFSLDYINVSSSNGSVTTNVLSTVLLFSATNSTIGAFVQSVVANINANTANSGYMAFANSGSTAIYISKAVTSAADPSLVVTVSVTPVSAGGAASPTVSVNPPSIVDAVTATVSAVVNPNNAATTLTFLYGTTTNYGSVSTAYPCGSGNVGVTVYGQLTGLSALTTYYFTATASNASGTAVAANSGQFTTNSTGGISSAPTVTIASATSIAPTSATMNATVNAGNLPTSVEFDYGLTTGYGSSVTVGGGNGNTGVNVSATAVGLTPATLYHYQAKVTNASGSATSSDQTFTTAAAAAPGTGGSTGGTVVPVNVTVAPATLFAVVTILPSFKGAGGYSLTTAQMTAVAASGTPPYTYFWEYVSGYSLTIDSPTSAATSFSAGFSGQTGGEVHNNAGGVGYYQCTVTDSAGSTVTSSLVSISVPAFSYGP